jgi:transcriptional regulator with XRE-family HTH domain
LDTHHSDNFYKLVGTKISNFRKEKKISQTTLATRMSISRSSIANIELGKQHTSLYVLWQIAEILKTPISEFFPSKQEIEIFSSNPNLIEALKLTSVSNSNRKSVSEFIGTIKSR